MGKKINAKIVGKRVTQDKIMYQIRKGGKSQWIEDSNIKGADIQLVTKYESTLKKEKIQSRPLENNSEEKTHKDMKAISNELMAPEKQETNKAVVRLEFISKVQDCIMLKAFFSDGSCAIMPSTEAQNLNPALLLAFYEKHIQII